MRRGEIWRVRIPFAPGRAQAGDRPALIVQNDPFIASLPTVLIVPFTSAITVADGQLKSGLLNWSGFLQPATARATPD
jgi:mRNA-degrading endonuclease toxin of MazEF toxin-antitoxin module